jgi:ribonuclease VapC
LIVVDSSALLAISFGEPDRDVLYRALQAADQVVISPINYVETGVILIRRGEHPDRDRFDGWLAELRIGVRDDIALSGHALAAYLQYGKGFHPARLNLADCFAYALAKALDAPLLYKGDDFAQTDVQSALSPQTPPPDEDDR